MKENRRKVKKIKKERSLIKEQKVLETLKPDLTMEEVEGNYMPLIDGNVGALETI